MSKISHHKNDMTSSGTSVIY